MQTIDDKIPTLTPSSWGKDLGLLLLLAMAMIGAFLGSHVLLTPDEARYTEVAREMLVQHNYVTPMVDGVFFLDKPALFYWLQASSLKLFGVNEWAVRLWPALFGVFGVLLTYVAGRKLYNRRTGLISAIVLLCCPLYFFAAHYVNMDLEVAVLVSGALYCYLIGMLKLTSSHRALWLYAAYAFAGLAMLTKGMLGLAFPMMVIGAWILCLNQWRYLRQMRLLSGLCLSLAIVLPWFILVQLANPSFFHYFFVTQQFSRFLTHGFNNQAPIWFYLPVVLVGMLPWTLFLGQGMIQQLKCLSKNHPDRDKSLYLLLWPLLIFIFFSIPSSKIVGYILPVIPPLALIAGHWIATQWEQPSKSLRISYLVFSIAALLLSLGIIVLCSNPKLAQFQPLFPYFYGVAAVLSIAAVVVLCVRKAILKFAYTAGATLLACVIIIAAMAKVPLESVKPFVPVVRQHITADTEVVSYQHFYQDLPMYLQRRITIVSDWDNPNIVKHDNWRRELYYGIQANPASRQWMINPTQFWQRWHSDKPMLVFLSKKHLLAFKAEAKSPVHVLKTSQHIALVSNF